MLNNSSPHTGYNIDVTEHSASQSQTLTLSGWLPIGEPENHAVQLTPVASGQPVTYYNKLSNGTGADKASFTPNTPIADAINVTASGGPGYATGINSGAGEQTFFVQAGGFNPSTLGEIYALNLKINGVADNGSSSNQTIINDLNRPFGPHTTPSFGVTASAMTPELQALFGNAPDGTPYDIVLTSNSGIANAPMDLAVDFRQEFNVPGVTVTDVAAMPEPASVTTILLGASGLLLGRRKQRKV